MPEATRYSQGAFCWAECATTDLDGAKAFYTRAFGLDVDETPLPEGGVYAQFRKDGKSVAGLTEQQPQEREQGVPPHWNTYIAVDDVDATTSKAEGLGATVLAPPFDVLQSGRMAVVMDPAGAPIAFWQARDHIGAQVYAEEGTIVWWELMTGDPSRATEFYVGLFGYETEDFPSQSGPYTVLKHKGENAAGIMQAPEPGVAVWTPYFGVGDAPAVHDRATSLGASAMMPMTEVEGIGRVSYLRDPQGAVIAFIEPEPRQPR